MFILSIAQSMLYVMAAGHITFLVGFLIVSHSKSVSRFGKEMFHLCMYARLLWVLRKVNGSINLTREAANKSQ